LKPIKPFLTAAIALNVVAASLGALAANDALGERVTFPEYDATTACLEHALLPDPECVSKEITVRALLLSTWTAITAEHGNAASTCSALLAHPDAAPASYSKLLACIAGELYASE